MENCCRNKASQPLLAPHGTQNFHPFLICPHHHHQLFHHHHLVHHHHHHHHHHQQQKHQHRQPICSLKPHCGVHNFLCVPKGNAPLRPSFTFSPPISCPISRNHEAVASVSTPNSLNLEVSECKDAEGSATLWQEEWIEELEEEEEEPVFILTDEWMEFFAKSEAKRRLEKKQAKKKGKN